MAHNDHTRTTHDDKRGTGLRLSLDYVCIFFLSFFSLLLIFFFGIRLRLCVQKPQASRRGMATLEEERATTGCREGMTTSAPAATATSATVARQLQARRDTSVTSRVLDMLFLFFLSDYYYLPDR